MQQTTKYQFNLIEDGDDFSPNPLNENMEKVEAQFHALDETDNALARELAGIAANLGTGGSNARLAWGSYSGNNLYGSAYPTTLTFDFKPIWVYVVAFSSITYQANMIRPSAAGSGPNGYLTVAWTDNGVSWYYGGNTGDAGLGQMNKQSYTYYYVAVGVAE